VGKPPPCATRPGPRPHRCKTCPPCSATPGEHGLSSKAYTGRSAYPVGFYQQLAGSPNIVRSDQIRTDATHLSQLSMIWHDSPADEHPPADVTTGQDTIWRAVDAIVAAGHW